MGGGIMQNPRQGDFLSYFIPAQAAIRRFVLAHVADFHAAEDIFQEIARALWERFDHFDKTRDFEPWAVGVARNMILRYRRDRAKDTLVFSEHVSTAICDRLTEQPQSLDERRVFLRECVRKLPPRSRSIVRMKYTEGRNIEDIASSVGKSCNAVRLLLFRIRGTIARCIGTMVSGKGEKGTATA
jgi:RNA polymerase sigma-70 factor (ECF subfamily)